MLKMQKYAEYLLITSNMCMSTSTSTSTNTRWESSCCNLKPSTTHDSFNSTSRLWNITFIYVHALGAGGILWALLPKNSCNFPLVWSKPMSHAYTQIPGLSTFAKLPVCHYIAWLNVIWQTLQVLLQYTYRMLRLLHLRSLLICDFWLLIIHDFLCCFSGIHMMSVVNFWVIVNGDSVCCGPFSSKQTTKSTLVVLCRSQRKCQT